MRYLITGIYGFAAKHLAELLLAGRHEVFGIARQAKPPAEAAEWLLRRPGLADQIAIGDVCDRAIVAEAFRRFRPDGVFHLAAQSYVGGGNDDAKETFAVNTIGVLQVLAAARVAGSGCRVLVVGSGESYGRSATAAATGEDAPLRPVSIYGVSKAAAELLMRQAVESRGTEALCARAFNHSGPGQSARFVCADFARQIVEIESGRRDRLRVGNLDAVRDFSDVRDVVRAYVRLWERGTAGEVYNVASGVGRRIGAVLDALRGRARCEIPVEADPDRLRPVEVPALVGDNTRLQGLGWRPEYPWEKTLDDVLADWRARLASGPS